MVALHAEHKAIAFLEGKRLADRSRHRDLTL
jgi:hypothetical protein